MWLSDMTNYVKIAPLELRKKRVFKRLPTDIKDALKSMPPEVNPWEHPNMLSMLRYNLIEYIANFYKKAMDGQMDMDTPLIIRLIKLQRRVPEVFESMAITPYEALGIIETETNRPPAWLERWTLNGLISLEEMHIMETGITTIILSNRILRQVNMGFAALQLIRNNIKVGDIVESDPIITTLLDIKDDWNLITSIKIVSGYLADSIEERYKLIYGSESDKIIKDQMLNFATFLMSELGGENNEIAKQAINRIVNY